MIHSGDRAPFGLFPCSGLRNLAIPDNLSGANL
jgi:hypothetical protein